MALWGYLQQVQRFLSDPAQLLYNPADLIQFVNQARARIAAEAQCVRVLPASGGSVASITLLTGGSGYSTQTTAVIGPPSGSGQVVQATASLTVQNFTFVGTGPITFVGTGPISWGNGSVTSLVLTNPGAGYITPPTVTFNDPAGLGSGATAVTTITPCVTTIQGQEVYPFAQVNAVITALNPGIKEIIGVQSIAVSWGARTPVLDQTDFSTLQAYMRSNNAIFTNYPTIWAQYGQGVNGSVYLWPIPSTTTPMQWDCYALPVDLVDDSTPEAIPYPWTDAVAYYATYLALLGLARGAGRDDTRYFLSEYKRVMIEGRTYTSPATTPTFYPSL